MSRHTSTLTTARRFAAVGGGLMLLLAPRDGKLLMQPPLREFYILAITLFVAAAMLFLFKSYEPLGASLVTVMALAGLQLLWSVGTQLVASIQKKVPFLYQVDYYDVVYWGAVWFVPFMICILIRLFARNEWDTPEKRADFCRFFKAASVAFLFYYAILFMVCFVFIRRVDLNAAHDYNLIPFRQMRDYFGSTENGMRYLFGNLFFFTPLGFFLAVYRSKWKWWNHLLIGVLFSGGIELLQYGLNCGMADVDDVILNAAGLLLGVGIKCLLDRLRATMTDREELSVQYVESGKDTE